MITNMLLLFSLIAGFVLLIATRALVIYSSRRSVAEHPRYREAAALAYFPLNTPGEAVRSISAFAKLIRGGPLSLPVIGAVVHLALWCLLLSLVVYGAIVDLITT